jgi:hypothetical protein
MNILIILIVQTLNAFIVTELMMEEFIWIYIFTVNLEDSYVG